MTTTPTQARLLFSASESDANMLWGTQFPAPDPFIFMEKRGKRYLVMSDLEMDRARDQAQIRGLGLNIHEAPGINSKNHSIRKTGHIVKVVPRLHYSGLGGVRLKDVVLVTRTGCRNLVRIPKVLRSRGTH